MRESNSMINIDSLASPQPAPKLSHYKGQGMGKFSRGYFGVGVENIKNGINIGTLWRSAFSFGAAYIFTIGQRYKLQSSDTTATWRHIPLYEFTDLEDFKRLRPKETITVGVEIVDDSKPLETFDHPQRAIYVLGPEDGSLSDGMKELCHSIVSIDTRFCLNVATAGSIVMYDRKMKEYGKKSSGRS